jgi:hypothetical protein
MKDCGDRITLKGGLPEYQWISNSGHRRNWKVMVTPAPVTVDIGGTGKEWQHLHQ